MRRPTRAARTNQLSCDSKTASCVAKTGASKKTVTKLLIYAGHACLARLTNAFSKKVENYALAVALFTTYYNFVRIH